MVLALQTGRIPPSWFQKAIEASQRAEGQCRSSLHEAVEVKPRLQWRFQDVGDARVVSNLLRRAAENQPKGEMDVAQDVGDARVVSDLSVKESCIEPTQKRDGCCRSKVVRQSF